ncbi:GLPGLI family protein [Aurantibacter crassamenti]|uniref:GLPGLI family protein n=1 Tax=Aurantibacter crassamenti TaxID=1837375 RepID=UPI00193A2765|nr:GLPGLI family protein [Aurantibacter crassamenti]MBM1106631.1 GLPGLI family protein [Aurantibacter crassamenti]
MRKLIISIITVILLVATANAQDFQGKAIYQTKTTVGEFRGRSDMPEAQRKRMMERIKKASEKTFELTFDKSSATYIKEEVLEAPSADGGGRGGRFRFGSADDGKLYKNIQDKSYTKEAEMFGKVFLIKDELQTYNWVMGSETKKIGNYTCYQATAVIPKDSTSFQTLMDKRRRERDRERNKEENKDESNEITSDEKSEEIITAWFTPEIPISNGPGNYWGLPGLILEVNTAKTTMLCTKIVLNADEKITIAASKKGKEINQADYDALLLKKMDEMSERFQGGRRSGGGPGGRRN